MRMSRTHLAAALLTIASSAASAALMDRGGGMIYDSQRNITWLANANYARTSGFDADGLMNWSDAMQWAANLNYGGYSDWRLPMSVNSGLNGYDCIGSEMCDLFYELGGAAGADLRQTHNDRFALFENIQGGYYWSETTHPIDSENAFNFNFEGGTQSSDNKVALSRWVWAVRDGDVTAVPEPATAALFLVGLAALYLRRRTIGARIR